MLFGYTKGRYSFRNMEFLFSSIIRFFKKSKISFKLSSAQLKDVPFRGYNGYKNIRHFHYIKVGLRKIKKLCFKIKLPLLLVYSKGDVIFTQNNSKYIYSHVKSRKKLLKKVSLRKGDISFKHYIWLNKYVKI